jgi:alkanesulfonate monooxygenase SsuD/methylene tetrahydromethanopterin reductase-like flavin-dependent oxidoreductase (luciferase family)
MRIGIGLPAGVPGTDMSGIGRWAAEAEQAGFASVGVFDRLIYENLDPLTALAAAAAATTRIELVSTVVNVCWRNNPVLLAKQLWSVDQLSGGRLRAGLGMGGWPADYAASGVALAGRGKALDDALAAMQRFWLEAGVSPTILLGGTVPVSLRRAVREPSAGWVSPLFDPAVLQDGASEVERAWSAAAREGRPRIATGRYFSLGPGAAETADRYIVHYYGADYFDAARADTLTSAERIRAELARLADAGCTDVVLFPCSGDVAQISLLAAAIGSSLDTKSEP